MGPQVAFELIATIAFFSCYMCVQGCQLPLVEIQQKPKYSPALLTVSGSPAAANISVVSYELSLAWRHQRPADMADV